MNEFTKKKPYYVITYLTVLEDGSDKEYTIKGFDTIEEAFIESLKDKENSVIVKQVEAKVSAVSDFYTPRDRYSLADMFGKYPRNNLAESEIGDKRL